MTIIYSIIILRALFDMFTKRQTLVSSPTERVKLIVVCEDTYHGIAMTIIYSIIILRAQFDIRIAENIGFLTNRKS